MVFQALEIWETIASIPNNSSPPNPLIRFLPLSSTKPNGFISGTHSSNNITVRSVHFQLNTAPVYLFFLPFNFPKRLAKNSCLPCLPLTLAKIRAKWSNPVL
ncbi:hypothetical protein CDAR_285861 [Caerostris darwini]|uniref:Uncharacterized protein n=1 Tax=Caerostris darwini TaxID=1538125 RepID=A0AAV4U0G7_9ARAC|nr:hypothetical protein CDAR_285861 [Caerostris darwini]